MALPERGQVVPSQVRGFRLTPENPSIVMRLRDAVSKDLRQHGHSVLTASKAVEALRISEEHKGAIDLLLTDVALPGMNGLELARHFLRKRPSSKVLYISGYDQDPFAANLPKSNSLVLLYKPFSSRELLAAISQALGQQAA